jgi:copper chaperone CopZ
MKKILIVLTASLALTLGAVAIACDGDKTETAEARPADLNLAQVVLTVSDATCGGCVHPIRKELTTLAGVHSVIGSEVDYKDVIVWVKPDVVSHEQLIAAVKKAGYTAVVKQEDRRQS